MSRFSSFAPRKTKKGARRATRRKSERRMLGGDARRLPSPPLPQGAAPMNEEIENAVAEAVVEAVVEQAVQEAVVEAVVEQAVQEAVVEAVVDEALNGG